MNDTPAEQLEQPETAPELPAGDAGDQEPSKAELERRLHEERRQLAQQPPAAPPAEDEPEAEPEAEPELEPELEPEQPPAPAPSPEQQQATDELVRNLEKERNRHRRALEKLLGAEVPLVECDKCEGQGQLPPWLVDDQVLEYQSDPHRHACASCQGEGFVDTGSKVKGQQVLPCLDCHGRGWVGDETLAPENGARVTVVEDWDPAWGAPPELPRATAAG